MYEVPNDREVLRPVNPCFGNFHSHSEPMPNPVVLQELLTDAMDAEDMFGLDELEDFARRLS